MRNNLIHSRIITHTEFILFHLYLHSHHSSSEWSFSFVASLGDDWPSAEDDDDDVIRAAIMQQQEEQQPQRQQPRGIIPRPLKRVAAWWRKNAASASES